MGRIHLFFQRCSKCKKVVKRNKNMRYCRICHNECIKRNRKRYKDLTEEEKQKDRARCKAGYAVRKGIIKIQPCEVCGKKKVQKHHDDYSKPLEVKFLCVKHHFELHRLKKGST